MAKIIYFMCNIGCEFSYFLSEESFLKYQCLKGKVFDSY